MQDPMRPWTRTSASTRTLALRVAALALPTAAGDAGQGFDEAGQQPGERRAFGVGPVGHRRGEDRAAKPVQLLEQSIAPLGPDQRRAATVGLIGFPAYQARL